MRRLMAAVIAAASGLVLALAVAPDEGAEAAFPATNNGLIAFSSNRDGPSREIYAMAADGSGQTRLTTNNAPDEFPAWSADGTKLAFYSTRDGNAEVYTMAADGSDQVNRTNGGLADSQPAWSPDGTRIVFQDNSNLHTMNADGSARAALTSNPGFTLSQEPAWSPDGTKIAYASTGPEHQDHEIWVMNANGTSPVQLTANTSDDNFPNWSPDGTKLAFTSKRDANNEEIYVMAADGSAQNRLTTNTAQDREPAWSPDGTKIAFATNRDGNTNFEIYAMAADGSNPVNLTNTPAPSGEFQPDWQSSAAPPTTTTTTATTTPPTTTTTTTTSPVEVIAEADTVEQNKMPKVVGRDIGRARKLIQAAIPNVNISVGFSRACGQGKTLDVISQNPPAGRFLETSASRVANVKLGVCVSDKKFLSDCDRKDLAKDLRELPKDGDAGLGTELLLRLSECKTDVDVKIAGAGKDATIGFDDLKRKGGKAAIEATLRCSRTKHDFAVALGEGLQPPKVTDAPFSFGERDGRWVLPGDERRLRSTVEIQVQSRTGALTPAEIYIDADDVKPSELLPGQVFRTDAGGHARFTVRPSKPGKIRVCAVQRVREGIATWAAEIQVVRAPKTGQIWKTVNGRHLEMTERGEGKLVAPPKARAAGIKELWESFLALFGGRSRAIAKAATSEGSVSLKAPQTVQAAEAGIAQITMDATLRADASAPSLVKGSCLSRVGSKLYASSCPTLLALGGHAIVGISANGVPLVAEGEGNVILKKIDPKDVGKPFVSDQGGGLIGLDGGTLIGLDGGTLIGLDGGTLVSENGLGLIGLDGGTFTGPNAPAILAAAGNVTAAVAPNAIAIAANQLVEGGAAELIGLDGGTLVPPGGIR